MADEIQRELIGFLRRWQEKHDLRPSEVVAALQEACAHMGPTPQNDDEPPQDPGHD